MRIQIVPIGNSKGVRIPRALLDLCHIEHAVNLSVKGEMIIIRPMKRRPREGWEVSFNAMHERGEDRPLIAENLDIDLGSWKW